jgi:hypothetical protein
MPDELGDFKQPELLKDKDIVAQLIQEGEQFDDLDEQSFEAFHKEISAIRDHMKIINEDPGRKPEKSDSVSLKYLNDGG